MARTLMRHTRPRSSMVCSSFTGIPCSSQAIRKGCTTRSSLSQPRNTYFTAPLAICFNVCLAPIVLFTDFRWAMSIVLILLTKLCPLGIPRLKHYVSISITAVHVKQFPMSHTALQLHFICTLIRVFHSILNYK